MAKRSTSAADSSITGYLHDVSPVKRSNSNNLYFNATFQNGDKLQRLVSFDPEKHTAFSNAEKMASPVQLSSINVEPSRDGQGTDIKVNRYSQLTILKEVNFKRRKLDFQETPLCNIRDVKHPSGLITIQAKVFEYSDMTQEPIFGRLIPKKEATVADKTGAITLNVYDILIQQLTTGKSYRIENVRSRHYDSLKLTTTPQSKVTIISDIENVNYTLVSDDITNTIVGTVTQISISKTKKCSACKKIIQPIDIGPKLTKCESCKMKMCSVNLLKSTICRMNITDATNQLHKVTAFEQTLLAFVTSGDVIHLLEDPDTLEEYFLGKNITAVCSNDICTNLSLLTSDQNPATSEMSPVQVEHPKPSTSQTTDSV